MTQPTIQPPDMRWRDYVLLRGPDLAAFWRDHCQQSHRKLLFVAGRGFDPRTTLGLEQIANLAGKCVLDLLALEFDEGTSHPPQHLVDAATNNWSILQSSIANEQLWFDPTIDILPTKFDIHPTAKAFAVAITWQFLAGTYSQTTSQLQLLTLKDDSQLQRVLSLPVQEIFQYRNCPELCETGAQGQICKVVCEGEDSQTVRELVVGKGQQQGYRDLWVTTTKSRVDAKQWTEQFKQRYLWHGADYRKE